MNVTFNLTQVWFDNYCPTVLSEDWPCKCQPLQPGGLAVSESVTVNCVCKHKQVLNNSLCSLEDKANGGAVKAFFCNSLLEGRGAVNLFHRSPPSKRASHMHLGEGTISFVMYRDHFYLYIPSLGGIQHALNQALLSPSSASD